MTTFQKWLDRIDNLLEVQKFSGEDTISASFTRRELIELKMMIGVASENGEEWNGFNKSVIAPKGTFKKIWEAEELLASAGMAFNPYDKGELLVIKCITEENYDIISINILLDMCGQPQLGNVEK